MHYVYILRSLPKGTLYVGTARDVEKRLQQHNAGYSRSTKASRPFELVHVEAFETLSDARRRERRLKCTPAGGKEKRRLTSGPAVRAPEARALSTWPLGQQAHYSYRDFRRQPSPTSPNPVIVGRNAA